MRKTITRQIECFPVAIEHEYAKELEAVSDILDRQANIAELVARDIRISERGRTGLNADQVIRAYIIRQMKGFSYRDLSFHIADSTSFQRFCRMSEFTASHSASTYQKLFKQISADTLEQINMVVLEYARQLGIEDGQKMRYDCTVVETNIHQPNDSSLLYDTVRTLVRFMFKAAENCSVPAFQDRQRAAKRRMLQIHRARKKDKRRQVYSELIEITQQTVDEARLVAAVARGHASAAGNIFLFWVVGQLLHFAKLGERVLDQSVSRVLLDETYPAKEKIFSIFEEHTDIIVKEPRETEYGHKVCLGVGKALVTDVTIEDGNPADSTLAIGMVERHKGIFGKVPRQVAFDGGFASLKNLGELKEKGIEDVAFHKKRGLKVPDMARSSAVYRALNRFRAGIEGIISFLKRCMGMRRCNWRGLASFKAYVWASAVTANLLILARMKT